MKFFKKLHKHGDTMIEVMLAMAIIGMVIGTAYTISNKSTQLGRLAAQRTQVNNLMRSQAELIKLFRDGNRGLWNGSGSVKGVKNFINTSGLLAEPSDKVDCSSSINSRTKPDSAFYVSSGASGSYSINSYDPEDPSASGDPSGQYQVWVEPYPSSGYTTFYIIGCWQGPGSYGMQQSFIVERLNNPS